MATYNSGQVKFGTPGGATVDSASMGTRRLYDFTDRDAPLLTGKGKSVLNL